jgi:hypothetical protein
MTRQRLGIVHRDSAFTQLDSILDRWARRINPLLGQTCPLLGHYYWVSGPELLAHRLGPLHATVKIPAARLVPAWPR